MLNKTFALGLLAATALMPLSDPAFAGEANASATSIQRSNQEAVNIGNFNDIRQDSTQVGIQDVDADSFSQGSANADAFLLQESDQTGVNVGNFNEIDQRNTQVDVQDVEAEQYSYPYWLY